MCVYVWGMMSIYTHTRGGGSHAAPTVGPSPALKTDRYAPKSPYLRFKGLAISYIHVARTNVVLIQGSSRQSGTKRIL